MKQRNQETSSKTEDKAKVKWERKYGKKNSRIRICWNGRDPQGSSALSPHRTIQKSPTMCIYKVSSWKWFATKPVTSTIFVQNTSSQFRLIYTLLIIGHVTSPDFPEWHIKLHGFVSARTFISERCLTFIWTLIKHQGNLFSWLVMIHCKNASFIPSLNWPMLCVQALGL